MNQLESGLVIALGEWSVLGGSKEIKAPLDLLQLSAAIRTDQLKVLEETLTKLQEEYELISSWSIENEQIHVVLSDSFPTSRASEHETEILTEKRIRRILLFKLYDVYRQKKNRYTHFPLASLSTPLGVDKDEIFRHVEHLIGEDYLEYRVYDGRQCTSDITSNGINLCESRSELFSVYGVIHPEVKEHTESEEEEELAADEYVSQERIKELQGISSSSFDLCKLIQLCKELNTAHRNRCYLSIAMILRTVINHVPPILGFAKFKEVASNYSGGKSLKHLMSRLNDSLRKVADTHLHTMARPKEVLPQFTQVDFRAELDVLLGEIVARLK